MKTSTVKTTPKIDLNGYKLPKTKGSRTMNKVAKALNRIHKQKNRVSAQLKRFEIEQPVIEAKNRLKNIKTTQKMVDLEARRQMAKTRNEYNAQRSGPIGWLGRRKQKKLAKHEADIQIEKNRPELERRRTNAEIYSDADVKKTKAKGAAFATAASALGTAIAGSKVSDNYAKAKQYEADIEANKALVTALQSVPEVTTDPYSNTSVSGLKTGVR